MEAFEKEPTSLTEDELYGRLTKALAEGTISISSSSDVIPVDELESRVRVLTFERDHATTLMQSTLAGRYAAFAARDATITERDAHMVYSDKLVAQARRVLEGQEKVICMAIALMDRVEAADH